jgi:hypothetical protein
MTMSISPDALKDLREFVAGWSNQHVKATSIEQAEQVADEVRRVCGEVVLEQAVTQTAGRASYRGCSVACPCGAVARFVSYRTRWVKALCGEVCVNRAYYHCTACHTGLVPWDRENGMSSLVWTPRVKALVAQTAARLTYGESVEMLADVGVIRTEESCAERMVAEIGERLRADEDAQIMRWQSVDPPSVEKDVVRGKRLYASLDAAKGHIDGRWHDVKVGMVYTVEPGKDGADVLKDRAYIAAQEHADEFGWRLYAKASEWGEAHYEETVVIGDGADYNWKIAEFHFPKATHVLDFMHACEHIWTLSHALYGEGSSQGKRWAQERIRSLKKDGPGPLLRALKRRKHKTEAEKAEVLRRETAYFLSNRHRTQYPKYISRGMMIGSGPVEAGCKVVVAQRMKQSGMRWVSKGADAMLALRTTVLNRDYNRLSAMARADYNGAYCYLH